MLWFVVRRIGEAIVSLLLLTVIVFLVTRVLGDPTASLLSIDATQEQREAVRQELGLDEPLHVQYGQFMGDLVQGDLGRSIHTRQPVASSIASRTPASLLLAGASMVVAVLIAVPLGLVSATRRGTAWDAVARGFAALGQSAPPFWVGLLLILVVAVRLGWLPAGGSGSLAHLVLPAFTLGWFISAGILRLLRSGLLEVLESDFMLFAESFGMSRRRALLQWALPNALLPVITFVGYMFGVIVAGAIVVEAVFIWPGLGRLAFEAVLARDLALIQGTVLVLAVVMIASNLFVDLLYGFVDPRVRVSGADSS